MPAPPPLGPIQVFGRGDDRGTRAAIRFFSERRIAAQVIDIRRKPIAVGELRRFVEQLGARALADTDGRAWRDAGLAYLSMTDEDLAGRILADQRLLRLPLVRIGTAVSAGPEPAAWKRLLGAWPDTRADGTTRRHDP
jgi:arsenate reductase (glutaredoxin)